MMVQPVPVIHGMWGYGRYKNHPGKGKEKCEGSDKNTSMSRPSGTGKKVNILV